MRPHARAPASVVLLLTGRCNLRCAYCYQTSRRDRRAMTWPTARAALERVLAAEPVSASIEFSGGEPLLNAAVLRRAVALVEAERSPRTCVEYTLTTNGALLREPLLAFLFEHGFTIRISFDGTEAAQRHRGDGTFRLLDDLLDRIRADYPAEYAGRVKVLMTMSGATLPCLGDGVRYFLEKGVSAVEVSSRVAPDPSWRASSRDELERQVGAVVAASVEHWRRYGRVPVSFLAGGPASGPGASGGEFMCGAPLGTALCVDPAGRAWACPLFAASLRDLPPLARQASAALDLGAIASPEFGRRLSALPGRARTLRAFTDRRAKRSSHGACAECRFVAGCGVCPASICGDPDGEDPDLVPDSVCAFNHVTMAARRRFDRMTAGAVRAARRRGLRDAMRGLEEAVARSLDPESGSRRLRAGATRKPRGKGVSR